MPTPEQPAYGDLKISLFPPNKRKGETQHTLVRQVFADKGTTSFYDEDAKDFVSWAGSWQIIETMGQFDGQDDARAFLLAREGQA